MDFVAQFAPTQTISVNPPGGTGHHGHHGHHGFPAPTVPSVRTCPLYLSHLGVHKSSGQIEIADDMDGAAFGRGRGPFFGTNRRRSETDYHRSECTSLYNVHDASADL